MIDILMSLFTNSIICVISGSVYSSFFSSLCVIRFCFFVISVWMPGMDFMLVDLNFFLVFLLNIFELCSETVSS